CAPDQSSAAGCDCLETTPELNHPSHECPTVRPTAPPSETVRVLHKIADEYTRARTPENHKHSSPRAETQTSGCCFHNRTLPIPSSAAAACLPHAALSRRAISPDTPWDHASAVRSPRRASCRSAHIHSADR